MSADNKRFALLYIKTKNIDTKSIYIPCDIY